MKSNKLIIGGIIAALLLGFIGIVGIGSLGFWGLDMFTEQARDALDENPVIQEHIGKIDQIDMDFTATGAASGDDTFVFEISGPRGKGVVTAEFITIDEDSEEVRSGTLRMSSGESHDLFPDGE